MPVVFGKIYELPEEYYILHYPKWSRSKLVFYVYLEALEYYQHFSRSIIRKTLWKTLPFSAPLIILIKLSNLINDVLKKQNPRMNLYTIRRAIDTAAFYELLVHTSIKF